jgi:hypothetical protein
MISLLNTKKRVRGSTIDFVEVRARESSVIYVYMYIERESYRERERQRERERVRGSTISFVEVREKERGRKGGRERVSEGKREKDYLCMCLFSLSVAVCFLYFRCFFRILRAFASAAREREKRVRAAPPPPFRA